MILTFLLQLVTLYFYVILMGFCFADGFGLSTKVKISWFIVFLAAALATFTIRKEFDLAFILPVPTILALFLCGYKKVRG